MIKKQVGKFLSVWVVIATFLTLFHMHPDAAQHDSCPVCIVKSHLFDADSPATVDYLPDAHPHAERILTPFSCMFSDTKYRAAQTRAPPSYV